MRHPCGQINSFLKGGTAKNMMADIDGQIDEVVWQDCLRTQQAKDYGLTLEKVKAMSLLERWTWDWLISNEKAIDESKKFENIKIVYYDDFCADPLKGSKEMFTFCNLPWHQQSQEFVEESVARTDQQYFSVFKDPLVAANKWREKMDPNDISLIKNIVMKSNLKARFENTF